MPAILNEIKDKLINIKKDHDIIGLTVLYSWHHPRLLENMKEI